MVMQATTNSEDSHEQQGAELQPPVRDADGVMSCLKRALKIANAAQQQMALTMKAADTTAARLFVEILDQYLYYFEDGLPSINTSVLQVRLDGSSALWNMQNASALCYAVGPDDCTLQPA